MPRFSYKVHGADGQSLSGTIEAVSQPAALEALLARGHTPVRLSKTGTGLGLKDWLKPQQKEFSVKDAGEFSGDIARLLASGFSLHQALQMTAVSASSKQARALAERAAESVQKGGSLYSVLAKESGGPAQALAGLVQAGETAGHLETVLQDASGSFNASASFKEKLGSALIYPAIILFMISMTLLVFFTFVLPRLRPLFEDVGDRLPVMTKSLLGFGRFCEIWGPWLALGILGLLIGMQVRPAVKRGVKRFFDRALLGRLGFGGPKLAGFATYARTLGLLLNSGVPLPSANSVAAGAVANLVLADKIENQSGGLRGGENLSTLLKAIPETPEVLIRMCVIGERSGKLGPALTDAAGILERSARTRTDRLMAALTPAITLLLGLIVSLVIGALFLGLASLTEIDV